MKKKRKAIKTKNKVIGIKDIAEHAQVSIGPVDRVLHNRGGVSEATRQRILKAIEELGYKPNILASRLKSGKVYTFAVLIPKATKKIPFWQQHQEGFDRALKELEQYGIQIEVFHFYQNKEQSFKQAVDKAIAGNFDGFLIVPIFRKESDRLILHCKDQGIPVIFFDSNLQEVDALSFIGQHSHDSGKLAADILHHCLDPEEELLVVRIVEKEDNHSHFLARERGFNNFFRHQNRIIHHYAAENLNDKALKAALVHFINTHNRVKGIFVSNAIHKVASIFEEEGIHNVKLIGYDLIEENVAYLKKGVINFLINQKPQYQAYLGIKLLYEYLVLKRPIEKSYFMPLDILMKTNIDYYR